nr:hypothetical protein GCM10020092_029110 [Actinoplanes digitatis]
MRALQPQLHAVRAQGHRAAVEQALRLAAPGDVVLVMYEKLAAVLDHLEELGAVPYGAAVVPAERLTARPTLDLGLLPTRAGSAPG